MESGVCLSGGGVLYFLGGKSSDAFVRPAFFFGWEIAGNSRRVENLVYFLGTCFQLVHRRRIL